MDATARFISLANITRFIDLIERSDNTGTQDILRQLLLEEEDRFARHAERLDITDYHIARAAARVTEQEQRIETLKGNGHNTAEAERLLGNMLSIREFLLDARTRLVDSANYTGP